MNTMNSLLDWLKRLMRVLAVLQKSLLRQYNQINNKQEPTTSIGIPFLQYIHSFWFPRANHLKLDRPINVCGEHELLQRTQKIRQLFTSYLIILLRKMIVTSINFVYTIHFILFSIFSWLENIKSSFTF